MHVRQHFMHAHLDKSLKTKLKMDRRTVQIHVGDTVKVMTGSKKGTSGKVVTVSMRTGKITIDTLTKKTARGKEYSMPINVSNVYITELNLTDKIRAAKLKVEVQKKSAAAATPAPEKKVEKPAEVRATAPTVTPKIE